MFNKKIKKQLGMLRTLGVVLIDDVMSMKKDILKLQEDKDSMLKEMSKRDQAFMDFLKVELTREKSITKGIDGKDVIKSTYKLLKK